jgi:hypothetical protein
MPANRTRCYAIPQRGTPLRQSGRPRRFAPRKAGSHWRGSFERTADDAKNFTRRGLLFQRIGKIAIPLLQFFEQPHIFDGDHRLGRKRFQQRHLLVSEGLDLFAPNGDNADGIPFS